MRTVSAYNARTNLGEILNEVYYKGEEIIIERKGKPMVRLVKVADSSAKKADAFWSAAGILKHIDTEKMKKSIYKARQDGSRHKKYLAKW